MSPERWSEIKRIFNEVVDLPPTEQKNILNSCCEDDEIRNEIEKMLAADSSTALEQSPLSVLADLDSTYFNDRKVGRYRILNEVGRGGMGAVFAAVRDDGEFEQKVAVKIIKRGLNTNKIIRRFRHERQILASLEHPNIARLLDGGMTEEGLSFYVMEFVKGEPIDEYCRAKELDIAEKLELFRQVCAAVSYAHGRLIVHRDLKPSNILVAENGQVKLLDFGIAKVLSENETGARNTGTELGLMTPDYASPEQFRGETVTTATDVYSLGIVLHELLTGVLPHDLRGLRLDQMLKTICETEPSRPSATTKSAINNPQLKGDLDNIILKALRKEPENRYASVEQFSEDIHRYLTGLPVMARPATVAYRAGKFIRRNRIAVALSVLVLLLLIGGIAATSWQAVRAERERSLAQKRFDQSREVAKSMVFKYHDAIANLPNSSPVRELLLKDASAYLDELAKDAKDNLTLQRELAMAYEKLGDIQGRPHSTSIGNTTSAIGNYEKSVSLFENIAANSPKSDKLEASQDLLTIYRKIALAMARAKEKEPRRKEFLDKRLSIIEKLLGQQPDDFKLRIEAADTYTNIGNRLLRADFEKGYQYYQEKVLPTLAEAQRLSPDDAETMKLEKNVYSSLGWYASEQGRLAEELGASREEARKYFERALEYFQNAARIYEKQFHSNPEDTSNRRGHTIGIVNVGIALRDMNRIDEALAHLTIGHSLYQELARFDANNLQAVFDLGDLYAATALCYVKKSEYAKAIDYFEKSLKHLDRVINADPKHHEAINYKLDVLTQMGNTCAETGNLSKALNYYEQARDFAGKNLTDESRDRIQMGRVHLNAGRTFIRFAEKEVSQLKARELWKQAQTELEKASEIIKATQVEETANQMRVIESQLLKCENALQLSN